MLRMGSTLTTTCVDREGHPVSRVSSGSLRRPAAMLRRLLAVPGFCAAFSFVGCRDSSQWDSAAIDEGSRRWLSVYRDADFRVYIDSANIHSRFSKTHTVWYRTDHRVPHLRKGKHWNREVSLSLISCSERLYKIISADLSLGNARPISQQRATGAEVADQPWRDVTPGSADEATLLATCAIAEQPRAPRRAAQVSGAAGQ